ncbi:MAG TPA: glycosyltransferase family 2 protein [Terriglobales bacterium]|nr:glycosyltransferase family 2 protein [Terriglobales bacterium]
MIWFWWGYSVFVGVTMLVIVLMGYIGLRRVPDLTWPEWDLWPPAPHPRLSVIVPAKNEEEGIGACLGSFLEQDYDNFEVIAVNDRSTDATPEIMEKLAAASAGRIRVLHIADLPSGWLGKQHAMWRAASLATGEWLLFTDGDVMFRADALRRAVAYAEQTRGDHLVLAPTLLAFTFGERIITAMIQMALVGLRPWKASDPDSRAFIGWGAFNMVRRRAYEGAGTMEALRLAVVEDMELGRRIKRNGFAARFAFGPQLVLLRWGRGMLGPVNNLTKNAYAGMGFRTWLALGAVVAILAFHILPFFLVWFAPGWTKVGFIVELFGIFLVYARLERIFDINPLYFFLNPFGAGLLCYAMLRSLVVTLRQGGIIWRGTKYSLAELRAAAPKPWE